MRALPPPRARLSHSAPGTRGSPGDHAGPALKSAGSSPQGKCIPPPLTCTSIPCPGALTPIRSAQIHHLQSQPFPVILCVGLSPSDCKLTQLWHPSLPWVGLSTHGKRAVGSERQVEPWRPGSWLPRPSSRFLCSPNCCHSRVRIMISPTSEPNSDQLLFSPD